MLIVRTSGAVLHPSLDSLGAALPLLALAGIVLAAGDRRARVTIVLLVVMALQAVTLFTLALIFRPLVLECVDPTFLRSVSRARTPTHLIFLSLVVLNLVGGFQALGTLLAVGLMMLPAAAARFWAADVTMMLVIATLLGVASGCAGLLLSFHLEWPDGPAIILTAGVVYIVSLVLGPEGGLLWLVRPRRHLEA